MRRFVFRLERVLKLRKRIEERVEKEFALKNAEYINVRNKIEENKSELKLFIGKNDLISGRFTINELQAVDNYIFRLEKLIQSLTVELKEKKREVDKIRDILNEAKKSRKVLEKLKENRLKDYLESANREEANEIDDISQKLQSNEERLVVKEIPLEET